MTFSRAVAINNWGPTKFVVDGTTVANGTHSTIAAALTSASSGDTIFIRPGTYTENLTLKAGVNLTAFVCDAFTPNVTISGTCSMTTAGTVSISGIRLASNGAEFLSVTGSAASIVNLINCYLTTAFDPGITFSSSSASAQIILSYCRGNISAAAKKFFAHSSAGTLGFASTYIDNTIGSVTASTCSAGTLLFGQSNFIFPITTSGTATLSMFDSAVDTSSMNVTSITCGGSGNGEIWNSGINSGSASAISVGSTLVISGCAVGSSATNAITGAGTIKYNGITFRSTSTTINTTTQTVSGTLQGSKNTAPTAGMLGEKLESTATSVAMTSGVANTVTSVTLTPGVWDISIICVTVPTGGTTLCSAFAAGISTTTNTLEGSAGIQYGQSNSTSSAVSTTVPNFRVTLTANTTYYLVAIVVYSSTTSPANGRISATRVG